MNSPPNKIIYTKSKARLRLMQTNPGKNENWLFLPGGPGLGSESLQGLADMLQLPGSVWHVDFPGDGSNTTSDDAKHFSHWSRALIEAASELPNTILVAHSSGGMFALSTPELENILSALVLMDSAPSKVWQAYFARYVTEHPLPEAAILQESYINHPSNEILKKLTLASVSYFSLPASSQKIAALFETLPFNHQSHLWAAKNFHLTYKAKWIPKTLPTLIFAGDQDIITPLNLFIIAKEFQRDNILIREIEHASHFPWMENPQQVKKVFDELIHRMAIA